MKILFYQWPVWLCWYFSLSVISCAWSPENWVFPCVCKWGRGLESNGVVERFERGEKRPHFPVIFLLLLTLFQIFPIFSLFAHLHPASTLYYILDLCKCPFLDWTRTYNYLFWKLHKRASILFLKWEKSLCTTKYKNTQATVEITYIIHVQVKVKEFFLSQWEYCLYITLICIKIILFSSTKFISFLKQV